MLMGVIRVRKAIHKRSSTWLAAILLINLLVLFSVWVFPQAEEKRKGEIAFKVRGSSFYEGKPKTKFVIYYDFRYDQLSFLKRDSIYAASFDISVVFYDTAGEQVGGDIWRDQVTAANFEETKSSSMRFASYVEFRILSGLYRMEVKLEDLSSARSGQIQKDVLVRSFGESDLEVSDPIFLHFFSDTLRIPNPSAEYYGATRIGVRFEIYSSSGVDSFPLETSLVDSRGKVWNSGVVMLKDRPKQTKTVVFSVDTLPADSYLFVITLADTTRARWPLLVRVPFFLDAEEYLERVDAMQYIASKDELRKLKEAASKERITAYREFWKKKDPTPSTERNEAEEEYLGRVNYANQHFGGLTPGWKTDRGMVYILYGRPDDIEKHPFEIDQPSSEVWYYYSSGLEFLFVDEHNLGKYELKRWGRR
ncbi:GWxTD domain-containing protein [candidate division TA06 bacterium]|uniref:GWxTD domain-containing protein n=1 Tax=candidate division TA06 bacterium TaxID=2250710 RepID=A0A523UNV1_UNCT6|nr:MAG: GWxTD domain-containing protein [candidate division TA06 bacterium]